MQSTVKSMDKDYAQVISECDDAKTKGIENPQIYVKVMSTCVTSKVNGKDVYCDPDQKECLLILKLRCSSDGKAKVTNISYRWGCGKVDDGKPHESDYCEDYELRERDEVDEDGKPVPGGKKGYYDEMHRWYDRRREERRREQEAGQK